jgi:hypothetical protein
MGADPAVTAALEAAIEAAGAGDAAATAPLRIHLAGVYLAGGEPGNGLRHALAAVDAVPTDSAALSLAATCAAATGDQALADKLRQRQADLLSTGTPPTSPPPPTDRHGPDPVRAEGGSDGPWPDDPDRVTFADVAGMDDVKRRLHVTLLAPLANAGLRDAFSKQLRGGLLLWGPPGTGKTFIARALGGEIGVPFLSATPADIYHSYFAASEQNVQRLFSSARVQAPAVVFLDELDALGGRRSARTTDQAKGVAQQLLIELDGTKRNTSVFLLAATNAPWEVDDAFRRPGRFDRTVLVLPPDDAARRALMRNDLAERPTAPDIDIEPIVRSTATYSGADVVRICEAASERALARSVDLGTVSPISNADLLEGRADTPPSTHDWLQTAATYIAASGKKDEDFDRLRRYLGAHGLRG